MSDKTCLEYFHKTEMAILIGQCLLSWSQPYLSSTLGQGLLLTVAECWKEAYPGELVATEHRKSSIHPLSLVALMPISIS